MARKRYSNTRAAAIAFIIGATISAPVVAATPEPAKDKAAGGNLKAARPNKKVDAQLVAPGRPTKSPPKSKSDAPKTAAVAPTAAAETTLSTVNVLGSLLDFAYDPGTSSSAYDMKIPLQETPRSIHVITRQVLDDEQAVDIDDALRNAPSVSIQPGGHGSSSFSIRGYQVTQTSVDGVSNFEERNNLETPSANLAGVQSVEVIKGPDSVMAGSSSPGGSINIVRKAPVRTPLHQLKLNYIQNDHDEYRGALDLGGPLDSDKSLAYRFNIAGSKSDGTYFDYDGGHSFFVAPVIGWRKNGTQFKLGGQFSKSRSSEGLSATYYDFADHRVADIPRLRYGDRDDHVSGNSSTVYYEFRQDLFPGWTFNSKLNYLDSGLDIRLYEAFAIMPNGDIVAHPFSSRIDLSSVSTQNDIRGQFDTGPIHHKVEIAFSYTKADSTQYDLSAGPLFGHNAFHPDSLNYPYIPKANQKSFTQEQDQHGWLLQDDASIFNNRLHFLFSGRYTHWNNELDVTATPDSKYDTNKFVPNYGISFDITKNITAYFNLLNGFYGAEQVNEDNKPLPPSTSQSKELGLKWELAQNQLSVTTDVYKIKENNVPIENTQTGQYVSSQGQSSEGFELDVNGSPLPGWNLTFGYTYSSVAAADNQSDLAETKVTGKPRNAVNLWTTYQLQHGKWKGLGGGFGVTAATHTVNGDNFGGYFKLPGYSQFDTSIFYRQKRWSVILGLKNIFDSRIYGYTSTPYFIAVKEGRNAHLTVYYDF